MKRSNTIDVFEQLTGEDCGDADTAVVDAETDVAVSTTREAERPAEAAERSDAAANVATTATPRPRRRLLVVAVSVVLLAALGSSAYLGWRFKQLHDIADASQEAVAAATEYAEVLTTLDSTDIDQHYTAALDGATGRFKDEYSQGAAQLRQVLIDNGAAGRGTVIDAAVKSATTTTVKVLLFVDQSITNVVNPSPRIDHNRVEMTMELIDGRWLASSVEIL
ncbi:Mce protein [Mycobacterium koreense]|uniref:Uncharacterized protein n=1 Tax=Mycolicibacillus koreensis TaxID=1069220 RepID=A0A7I7SH77_9MYCO|nr:hypothetical protein [Mycolicibacillus koreensis]MCV7248336.1 Mce protein [Mycolicibacillus koreensis]ODR09538.1 hypothetical protein BHQ15_07150 [Mycolicibacillus koreensis]OSC34289.1 hypothetical protein B8W67_06995 [Mycolicibacillus koreensis]BBY55276.1 hypothetical protein MKOR_25270 [Mycolicibacillus koreensis]